MKVSDTITYCIHNQKINSRPNTLANYEYLLGKLGNKYQGRYIDSISTEDIIAFLAEITEGRKQNTKRSRDTTMSPFSRNLKPLTGQYLIKTLSMRQSSGP